MNELVWKRIKPLVKSDTFKQFEIEYNMKVPEELKTLIVDYNGGRPSLDTFKSFAGDEFEVKALLSYNQEDIENIYKVIGYFKEKFNGKLLPFASESSGNYYCINLSSGAIVYWDHETADTIHMEDCLSSFLNGLYATQHK